ncbi:antitoxin [Leptospira licerasiae]|uniref:antitoxin n=1 Tax=Leptospira licerasiae TaxID=447106 RepID=UPI001AEFFD1E|nr:antitoxin [Leptospira licerasiae]
MRKVVSVSLDEELESMLLKSARRQKVSKSEVVQMALKQYFFLTDAKRFRKDLKKYAEKAGYLSDEDIYKDIS